MSTKERQGLSLYDAAREVGVSFEKEWKPESKSIEVNGMKFHYLEWGDPANPVMVLLHGLPNNHILGTSLPCHSQTEIE